MHIIHGYSNSGDILLTFTLDDTEVDSIYTTGAGREEFWNKLAKLGLSFGDYGKRFVVALTARDLFERQLGSPEAAENWLLSQVQTMLTS
jgi:hypothetical protein